MVKVYNSRTVSSMPQEDIDAIIAAKVPMEIYTSNYTDLGPANRSALGRFANICQAVLDNKLPIPPSPFIEHIVDLTTGKSKQDFSMTMDAKKGAGKSWSGGYIGARYATEVADRWGHNASDYFSLENCALLEDTEGISNILETAEKYQAIMIDDAGTAIGSRDFAQQKNKNFNKILTVCRTKRWFVILNSPMATHLDLQVRELVDASAHIYKSFHDKEFNIYKINITESKFRFGKKHIFERRFSFFDRKFDFWCAYSPDKLDPFKGFTAKYDKQREEAANRLITKISADEKERKNHVSPREKKKKENLEKYGTTVKQMLEEGKSFREIARKTGLSDYMLNITIAEMGLK
jgi:hypothetical protein